MIENDKPIGVILTIEEYELLRSKEMNFPQASAEIADIESADDVTLEDLGVDELS